MIKLDLNSLQVFAMLRISCGVSLIINICCNQWINFKAFYTVEGMVRPELFNFFTSSPLFIIWDNEGIKWLLFILLFIFSLMFCLGVYARIIHFPLLLLNLSFLLANPMVIHEPQQLTQLLLFLLLFVPYEKYYLILASPGFSSYEEMPDFYRRKIIYMLMIFLGYYYFLAGFKKLPDPLWYNGGALQVLLNSPYLGIENNFSKWFTTSWGSKLGTWLALAFELSFLFLTFTSYRRWLIPAGAAFHFANIFMFDVGYFWMAMLMWYPCLLLKRDAKKPWAL